MTTTTQAPAADTHTAGFNLHALVLEVVRSHPSPNPDDITATVLDRAQLALGSLPSTWLPVAALTLRGYVADVIRAQRGAPPDPTKEGTRPTSDSSGRGRAGSWKRSGIRAAWRRRPYPGADGAWKFLQDFTHADLIAAAALRRDQARANVHEAQRLEAAARLLADADAATLGELDDDAVSAVLDGAA